MTHAQIRGAILLVAFVSAFAPLTGRAQSAAPVQAPAAGPAGAATANGGKPISIEDCARFKRIAGATISSDGKWMAYTVTPNEGDGTLIVQSLDTATKHEIPRGTGASFSPSARHVGYFINPPAGRGRGAGRGAGPGAGGAPAAPTARAFEIFDLSTGMKSSLPAVASFAYSPDGEWLLIRPQTAAPGSSLAFAHRHTIAPTPARPRPLS